jgi:mannose-6-phosphate isomerase-like protein (cupin superfamily)
MTVSAKKHPPRAAVRIAADQLFRGESPWSGSIDGDALGSDVTLLFVNVDPGKGPSWHVHPYDEVFIITEGTALFTVGDERIEAKEGDVVMGPANVPHKYHNAGTGPLRSIDIHLSPKWIQTDLVDPEL